MNKGRKGPCIFYFDEDAHDQFKTANRLRRQTQTPSSRLLGVPHEFAVTYGALADSAPRKSSAAHWVLGLIDESSVLSSCPTLESKGVCEPPPGGELEARRGGHETPPRGELSINLVCPNTLSTRRGATFVENVLSG
eukprot:scaffold45935_cov24-Tisochrysis_lutea.AAC.5